MKKLLLRLLKKNARHAAKGPPAGSYMAALKVLRRGEQGQNLNLLAVQQWRALRGKTLLSFEGMQSVEEAFLHLGPKGSFHVGTCDKGVWIRPVGDKARRHLDEVFDELSSDAFRGAQLWSDSNFGGSRWRKSLTFTFKGEAEGVLPPEVAQSVRDALLSMPRIP